MRGSGGSNPDFDRRLGRYADHATELTADARHSLRGSHIVIIEPAAAASRFTEIRQALAPLRKQIQRIEKNVAKYEAEKAEIEARMADPAIYEGDSAKLVELQKDLGWISRQLSEAEEAWLELQQEFEQASAE